MGGPSTRTTLAAALLAIAAVSSAPEGLAQKAGAASTENPARSLDAVRTRIHGLEERVAKETVERDAAAKELKRLELEIGEASKKLAALRARSAEQQRKRQDLGRERAEAEARLAAEREALAGQVRASYMNGRAEMLKLLLSQESPAAFGRMTVYYEYLNRARSRRIEAVSSELATLARVASEGTAVAEDLARLEQAQAAEVAELDRSRKEREALLGNLDDSISSAGGEIGDLKAQEARLSKLVADIADVMARFPPDTEDPFKSAKGRLAWPVSGKVAGDYGERINGGPVRRSGVLLAAPEGTPVRAVYHGRVAYADWLPGLGLLIVIDHGDGYMSLYGHNSALLKEAGDWVAPGEPIAEAGDTGGQSQPSVYFEIRHDGKPVDPHDWVAR
ncbi:MAG TPA: peptidoglycan DD-metalloendopeptidase family protein [Gammaproteobacteria bacterium]|nr:peptidoglycan DD-metalloendopeptidase family protein [Gammaproteobacteria bacterium]